MKPQRRCNHAGCRTLVTFDKKFCEKHLTTKDRNEQNDYQKRIVKDEKYIRFYNSKQWRNVSRIHKLNNPLCAECLHEGIIKKADVTDHIHELRDRWELRLESGNLRSLCHTHHNTKTARERERREQNTSN